MSYSNGLPRIFIQIPSYRDRECQWTVRDLFEKAKHPERIFVGICWQYDALQDVDCFIEPYPFPEQVRIKQFSVAESKGCAWARVQAQSLWQGEEYVLQIDAHMRFEKQWDEILIQMLESCDSHKAVLSCYPPAYIPGQPITNSCVTGLVALRFDVPSSVPMMRWLYFPENFRPDKPIEGCFVAGGFLFAKSQAFEEVPLDPHLYFWGEQIALSVKLWTHGYDIYHPNEPVIYHFYNQERHEHSRDYEAEAKATKRLKHMFGLELSQDPEILLDVDKYGVGDVRSFADYEKFSGLDFRSHTLSEAAQKGIFMDKFQGVPVSSMNSGHHDWIRSMLRSCTNIQDVKDTMCVGFPKNEVDSIVDRLAQELGIGEIRKAYRVIDDALCRWMANGLLTGCTIDQLHTSLVEASVDSKEALKKLQDIASSPLLPEAIALIEKLKSER